MNEGGYQIEGQTDTWKVIDEKNVQEQRFVQLVCEQTKKQKPDIVLHDSGVLVAQTIYGFDSLVMKKVSSRTKAGTAASSEVFGEWHRRTCQRIRHRAELQHD